MQDFDQVYPLDLSMLETIEEKKEIPKKQRKQRRLTHHGLR